MPPKPEDFPTPGQYIRALLNDRNWDQRTLSHVLGMDYGSISKIVLDKKPVTAFAAIVLGDVFGVAAEGFLELQKRYDLAIARATARPDKGRAVRAELFGSLPVAEMIRRGWLDVPNFKDIEAVERSLARFFAVDAAADIPSMPHAAKKSEMGTAATPAQVAWLFRVRAVAATVQAHRYTVAGVRDAVTKLEGMLKSADGIGDVPQILAGCGIRLVVVEALSTTKIDGVTTWLNDMQPIIGLTLRHDRIDNFWFVLRHEIEHVLRGHGRKHPIVDVDLETIGDARVIEEEKVSNEAASDFCVPRADMDKFIAKKKPYFIERDVIGFAAVLRRHPGLVVGQLQHRVSRFDRFRRHLIAVRERILPSVPFDGWGNIFPVSQPVGMQ